MSLKKLSKPPFLNSDEVQKGDVLTVVDEPYIISAEQSKWGKERGRVTVQLPNNGEKRTWTMNNTTWDKLIDAFGASPQGWIGKKVQLDIQMMNVRGEPKRVLYGKPYTEIKQQGLPA